MKRKENGKESRNKKEEKAKITQIMANEKKKKRIDNLYLDMNGIIHNCTHGDGEENLSLSEDVMFQEIFKYVETLFTLIKPRKLFYLAIDG